MRLTRRNLLATAAVAPLARPALGASEPIRIGWLPALTGPSSITGIAITRGVELAIEEINKSGGVGGRMLEVVQRDTQSDPTKAVNAAVELMRSTKVNVLFGPGNSGESLAVTPIIARQKVVQIDPCWVDSLIDVKKYPLAFRDAPCNQQIGAAANHYVLEVLKVKDVAVVGDTTGYGTASVDAYVPMLKEKGANVVYKGEVDAAEPDVKPELLRMRDAGAKVIMPWSVNAGFLARIINTRAQMGWDVPIAGQTTLGSGQVKALLDKPENWNNVFQIGFRATSIGADGKLPPRTQAFMDKLRAAKVEMSDTLLWWIACGYDVPYLVRDSVKAAGTDSAKIAGWLNTVKRYPGVYGEYTFTPKDHNGYPDDGVVMSEANSFHEGTFKLAPGYAA